MLRFSLISLLLISVVAFGQDWTPQSDVYYRMVFKHSGKVIRPINASTDNVETEQWEINAVDESQLWSFKHIDGNYYMAINKKSAKAFDIWDSDPNDIVGVWTPKPAGNENQQIRFQSAGGEYYYIYDRLHNNVADVTQSGTQNGARVISYPNHNGQNEQVKFVPVISAKPRLRVQFRDVDGTPYSDMMRLDFEIYNDGPTAFALNNTTLTYYFSNPPRNWNWSVWSFLCNSSQLNTSSITTNVVAEPSLPNGWALTLKFSDGIIIKNSSCLVRVGVGVTNEAWQTDKTDDYSYMGGSTFQDDNHIILTQESQESPESPLSVSTLWGVRSFKAAETGNLFNVIRNPIISHIYPGHNSSDPALTVVDNTLVMVTSKDLDVSGEWPMDGTYLYTTNSQNSLCTQWWAHGDVQNNVVQPVFVSQDFHWWAETTNPHMFAPDIQYVKEKKQIFMYIPMPYAGSQNWGIGVASVSTTNRGSQYEPYFYDQFSTSTIPFTLYNPWTGIDSPIDPGVIAQEDATGQNTGSYYMVYVDHKWGNVDPSVGNISMARLRDDMKSGDCIGKVGFKDRYANYSNLVNYMEGPDVAVMHTKSNHYYYYMIFVAGSGDNKSKLIGYAMASADDFAKEQTHCWNFKGWIFQDLGSGNNHANLVQKDDKCYIFYHRGFDSGLPRREAWCKEIKLADNPNQNSYLPEDGEIIGVTRRNGTNIENIGDYGSLDGKTAEINWIPKYLRNANYDGVSWSYVTLSSDLTFNDGTGIYNRYLGKGSERQEWIFENVAGTQIGNTTLPENAVRIRNLMTPDKCMTCGSTPYNYNSSTGEPNYGIFNNTFNSNSLYQIWIKESCDGAPYCYKLRNFSNNKYLTRYSTGESATYCNNNNTGNSQANQKWFFE